MNETPETITAPPAPETPPSPTARARLDDAAKRHGDTPANSTVCALTVQYVEWWLSSESDAP